MSTAILRSALKIELFRFAGRFAEETVNAVLNVRIIVLKTFYQRIDFTK